MCVMTMSAAPTHSIDPYAPAERVRIAWLELTCLPCGEVAGYVEDHRFVRPSLLVPGWTSSRTYVYAGKAGL